MRKFLTLTIVCMSMLLAFMQTTALAAPNSAYQIDLYYTGICAPLGYGEGAFLQTVKVTTDATGRAKFNVVITQTDLQPGQSVTAITATKRGNTSEFGKCKAAQ